MKSISQDAKIAYVRLCVNDLKKSEAFYGALLGFRDVARTDSEVALSSTGQLPFHIHLKENPQAKRPPHGSAGLFHVAIRFPDRQELAKTLLRLIEASYPIQGASDHAVSEAIYLADPEGNGIELYCDRPRDSWRWQNGEVYMVTEPLDVEGLLQTADGKWDGLHHQTDIGHVHLSVTNLAKVEEFYVKNIGFGVTARSYPGALFLAAGSYHHHIGTNIWASRNGAARQQNTTGILAFGVSLPQIEWEAMRQGLAESKLSYTSSSILGKEPILRLHDLDGIGVEFIQTAM
ncbi:MAG: VOC family protein [Bacteroidetes bacterium]|nr:VOC family protein [Bacteroidota bacterium]MCW5896080.1 VOC family protein [Bacteroidota bacterium]